MKYYCYVCREPITENIYRYSMSHHGKALCMNCQKTFPTPKTPPIPYQNREKITPQAIKLSNALKRLDIKHKLEYWDGHKHVDIAIPWAKLYLEIEGKQHGFNPKQVSSDHDRDTHSQKEGFYTKRIYNEWIDRDADQIALGVARLARKRYRQIKEQQSVIGKLKKGYGVLKTGYSILAKISDNIEDDEDFRDDDYY